MALGILVMLDVPLGVLVMQDVPLGVLVMQDVPLAVLVMQDVALAASYTGSRLLHEDKPGYKHYLKVMGHCTAGGSYIVVPKLT